MVKKELFWELAVKAVKMLVALFALFAAGYFVESLPYAGSLPFLSGKLPVGVFLNAVISLLAVVLFVKFGAEASPSADGLLDFIPGAGKLARSVVKILALMFSYYAFQDAVFPFIADFEWVYQALFLGFTLFYVVRAVLQVYYSSEEISRFLIATLRAVKDTSKAAPPKDNPPA
jgi:hypothetical protein